MYKNLLKPLRILLGNGLTGVCRNCTAHLLLLFYLNIFCKIIGRASASSILNGKSSIVDIELQRIVWIDLEVCLLSCS